MQMISKCELFPNENAFQMRMISKCECFAKDYDIMSLPTILIFKEGKVINWKDLDCDIYANKEEADKGHCEMVNKWIHK